MQWYVLRSKPHKEEALWREVVARGIEAFYPGVRVKPANPRSRTMRPYFPGYLFVRTHLAEVGQSVFAWLPLAQGLVSFGGEPAVVPDVLVGIIKRRVDEINAAGDEPMVRLVRGETVVIHGGPFDKYEALFDAHVGGAERVRVLLKLLEQRHVRLDLPRQQIEQKKKR